MIPLQDYYRVNAFSSKFNAVYVFVCKDDGADTGDAQNDYMLYRLYV